MLKGHLPPRAPDPVPLILAVKTRQNCSGSGEPGQYASAQCLEFGVISVSLEGRSMVLVCSAQDGHGCKALFEELTGTTLLPGATPPGAEGAELGGAAPRWRGCRVVAEDGTALGVLGSKEDPDSVCNPFSLRGSPHAPESVWNRHNRHGGEHSPTGTLNPHAQRPPSIVCGNAPSGRLSRNRHLPGAVDPSEACPGRVE